MALLFAPVSLTAIYGLTWTDTIPLSDKLTGQPVDLTGCELLMRIRARAEDTTHLLELSTQEGTLSLVNAAEGLIGVNVPKAVMQGLPDPLPRKKKKYVYDMTILRGSTTEPGIAGRFALRAQVTRDWQPT